MTISLTHPVLGAFAEGRIDVKRVEAALAALSYWNQPSTPATPVEAKPDLTPLEQMYAYYD